MKAALLLGIKKTIKNTFAFVYIMLGVPLAAGVYFPFTDWLLSPIIGALTMSLSSVPTVGNVLRLKISVLKPERSAPTAGFGVRLPVVNGDVRSLQTENCIYPERADRRRLEIEPDLAELHA